jgi:predicted transcriptional regulator of viral defense system
MEFERLLSLIGNEPVFNSALLLAGNVNPATVRIQLTRWSDRGLIIQLRRGLYSLAPPYQKVKPHPFMIANLMQRASYVSCQSALSFYALIPDVVPATVSVTTRRPRRWETTLGTFLFRHVKLNLMRGYHLTELGNGQRAFIATPEKALLDLVYLHAKGDSAAYLNELRLQNLDRLNMEELFRHADWFTTAKIRRAVEIVVSLAQAESEAYQTM